MSSSSQQASVFLALRRRWYLTVIGLMIGAGVIVTTLIVVPVTYTAQADVLLVPPKAPDASNPLLELGGLEDVPVTISRSVFTDTAVAALAKQGVTSGYSVATDLTTSAPLLLVTGAGKSPAEAIAAMRAVADLVPTTLTRLQVQQRVAETDRITTSVIHADTSATEVTRTRTRLLFIAVLIALLLTIGLPVVVDRLLLRRSGRRSKPLERSEPLERGTDVTPVTIAVQENATAPKVSPPVRDLAPRLRDSVPPTPARRMPAHSRGPRPGRRPSEPTSLDT